MRKQLKSVASLYAYQDGSDIIMMVMIKVLLWWCYHIMMKILTEPEATTHVRQAPPHSAINLNPPLQCNEVQYINVYF